MPPSPYVSVWSLFSVLVDFPLVRLLRRQKYHPPMNAITRTPAMAIPAIAPPPRPAPLFSDAAVGTFSSGDCEVNAPLTLCVLDASGPIVELNTVSEPIDEAIDVLMIEGALL